MKKVFLLLIVTLAISCQNNSSKKNETSFLNKRDYEAISKNVSIYSFKRIYKKSKFKLDSIKIYPVSETKICNLIYFTLDDSVKHKYHYMLDFNLVDDTLRYNQMEFLDSLKFETIIKNTKSLNKTKS